VRNSQIKKSIAGKKKWKEVKESIVRNHKMVFGPSMNCRKKTMEGK
jgi:hypothetical protein